MALATLGLIAIVLYGLVDFGRTALLESERSRQIAEMLEGVARERRARPFIQDRDPGDENDARQVP